MSESEYNIKPIQQKAYEAAVDQIDRILKHKVLHRPDRIMLLMNLIMNISVEFIQRYPELKNEIKLQLQEYYMMLTLSIDAIDEDGKQDEQKLKQVDKVNDIILTENDKIFEKRFGYMGKDKK